jgi:hypothetical protein
MTLAVRIQRSRLVVLLLDAVAGGTVHCFGTAHALCRHLVCMHHNVCWKHSADAYRLKSARQLRDLVKLLALNLIMRCMVDCDV